MMKKQILAFFMAASLSAAAMTGCASSPSENETTAQETVVNVSLDDEIGRAHV